MDRSCIFAAFIAIFFVAMGCSEEKITYPTYPSLGTEEARQHRESYSGFAPANFGDKESRQGAWFPDTPLEAGIVLVGLVLTVLGGWLLYRRERLGLASVSLAFGLGIMLFTLMPVNAHFHPVPHADWMWVLPLAVIWAVAKFSTQTTLNDKEIKVWLLLLTVVVLALRGLFGAMSPSSAFWWILLLVWVTAGAEAAVAGLRTRPVAQKVVLFCGWYLLAVLA